MYRNTILEKSIFLKKRFNYVLFWNLFQDWRPWDSNYTDKGGYRGKVLKNIWMVWYIIYIYRDIYLKTSQWFDLWLTEKKNKYLWSLLMDVFTSIVHYRCTVTTSISGTKCDEFNGITESRQYKSIKYLQCFYWKIL